MQELWHSFFAINSFIPHGGCYLWKPELVGLHIVSDSLIALAYYSIPAGLGYFIWKRRYLPYPWLLLLFGAFIIACGTGYIMDVWTLWHPTYWLSGLVKAFTALISVYTAVTLLPMIPQALALLSPIQLEAEIAKRQRVEEELRRSRQMLQLVMDTIPQTIFWKDRNLVYLGCNRNFARAAGLDAPEAVIGLTDYDMPWKLEETEFFRECDRLVMETDAPQYHIIEPLLQADGKQCWLDTSKIPLHDLDENVVGILGMFEDITERKQAEEALRTSETELKALFAAMKDVILVMDDRSRYLKIAPTNPNLLYKPSQEILGKTAYDVFPQKTADYLCGFIRQALDSQQPVDVEYSLTIGDSILWFSGCVSPMTDKTIIWVARDITERKQAEEALKKAKEELEIRVEERTVQLKQANERLQQSETKFRELATREALLNRLANQIRSSLDINIILATAVQEIRDLLDVDRCLFIWYRPQASNSVWEVVQEARNAAFSSLLGHVIPVKALGPLAANIFHKEITRVDNARILTNPVERRFFFSVGYTALLALPIHTTSGEIGVVSCGHSSGARPWRDSEVELLQAVADQIAIAIDQAQLYKQTRTAAVAAQEQAAKLERALLELQQTQAQLIQSEKMSSLGQLVAGVAHEINNPINFIYGNINPAKQYAAELIDLVKVYQENYPNPNREIQEKIEAIDLDFIKEDLQKIMSSMKMGADRIRSIVLSLRNFSRLDEATMKAVDIHEGLDSTLLIVQNRLKIKPSYPEIKVIKEYGKLPLVECYAGQLNQVFMNIITNAIDALEEAIVNGNYDDRPPTIRIRTEVLESNWVAIRIADNGLGISKSVKGRLFDPFFTTKPVGKGTGLGLSVCYQIVTQKHNGFLKCISEPGQGAEFVIDIPVHQAISCPLI